MLELSGINQYYGGSHILNEVNLKVSDGEMVCLLGRNGVGKTTLMRSVMGMVAIKTGKLLFAGKNITQTTTEQRARAGIGFVPQGREIFPLLTVEENLKLALAGRRDGLRNVPAHIYTLFPVLLDMRHRRGGDLSGGQQQQLAIGRALVLDPKILLLDEPTEGIQPNIVVEIGQVLRRLNQELGLAVLLVEQKLPFARQVADRFVIMERGQIQATDEMSALDDTLIQRYLTV
ncbi:MAG: urea ABC transporter ATP-binding subunit UrtE [Halothiobacillus sp. 24-54-40]|jgi:urea transport system ATP-binding protein|nr:urea ABC transporter ATP-binding subunit UrtE [Halothiobacillaceae bacterium]OYV46884.1 MAG: urea ABC transporter ATP-binding subunit UrtE [Halothiobacillus sp. 20-53-49]OYY36282.1 MAG: urea ABC transporter ATP-binding subunit UrtE [Halothiobacillus sp. 35-54-62]OYY55005.1 MAG: urea ABC transporter ATP-binding subunit UrtE [Halothiobacillus sp. 28-55-5]OYZ87061.1 MAG: urea ABC transporter ATP-binding subunit UrtE [Halothiobacillus sp. 24-54-40]OZA80617.1 MAG: urea ABC transporter ATP-bindin